MSLRIDRSILLRKEYIFAILFLTMSLFMGIICSVKKMAYDYFFLLVIPSSIYLLYINNESFMEHVHFQEQKKITLLLNSFFILFYFLSIAVLHFALYERPLLYFLFIFIIIILLGVEIVISPDLSKKMQFFYIFKIILIAINLRWSIVYMLPSIVGNDTWFYARIAETIAIMGHIPSRYEMGMYSYYPTAFLEIGTIQTLTSLNIKDSIFCSLGLIEIFSLIFIYLIGKLISDARIGLLAALFMAISGHHILYGSRELISMSMGYFFFSVIVYLFLKNAYTPQKNMILKILVLFFLAVLVITHTLSSAIMILVLTSLYFGGKIYNLFFNVEYNQKAVVYSVVLFFFVVTIGYWIYVSGFVLDIVYALKSAIEIDVSNTITNQVSYLNTGIYRYFDLAEELLWISFFILGFLYLSKNGFRKHNFFLLLLSFAGGVLAFTIFLMILGKSISLLPYRFYIFAYFFVSFTFSTGILYFINIPKNKYCKISLFVIILILFSISSIAGPTANRTALYSNNEPLTNGFTQSEIYAGNWFIKMYAQYNINSFSQGSSRYIGNLVDPLFASNTIGTDLYYTGYFTRYNLIPTTDFFPIVKSGQYNKLDSLILRRKLLEGPFLALAKYDPSNSRYSEMIVEPQENMTNELINFNKIYNSQSVIIFKNNNDYS